MTSTLHEIQVAMPEASCLLDACIDAALLSYFEQHSIIDREDLAKSIRCKLEAQFVVLPVKDTSKLAMPKAR